VALRTIPRSESRVFVLCRLPALDMTAHALK
jgi:hypothetical protein